MGGTKRCIFVEIMNRNGNMLLAEGVLDSLGTLYDRWSARGLGFVRVMSVMLCVVLGWQAMRAQGTESTGARSVTISGYVLDRERQPVPLANVRIEGKDLGTVSNVKGYYQFSTRPTTDSVTLVFSSIGYKTSRRTLPSLMSNQRITVELGEDELLIDTLQVVARRAQVAPIERIDAKHLEVSTGPTGGVEGLVGTMTGVAQKNELSSQYTVRGGSFDENLVYINGVEVYRPLLIRSAEQEGLSAVNPDMTGSLLFSAGGFGAEYGDKISSVLDVRYRRPERLEGSAVLGLLESKAYVGSRHGKLRQTTGVRYKRGNSLLSTLDTDAEYDPHYYDAQTNITYTLTPAIELSLLVGINGTDYSFVPRTRQTSFGTLSNAKQLTVAFDGREEDSFRTVLGALSLQWVPNARLRHSLMYSVYSSRERETYDIAGEYILSDAMDSQISGGSSPLDDRTNALGIGRSRSHGRNYMNYGMQALGWRSNLALGDRHQLLVGADARFERIEERVSEWEMRDSVGYTTPISTEMLTALRSLRGDQSLRGARIVGLVEDRLRLKLDAGELGLNLGLRLGWWSWSGELYMSPRASMSFRPARHDAVTYRLALGLYQQAPSYREVKRELTNAAGEGIVELNSNIRSQSALMALVGMDYDFEMIGRKFKFTGETYLKYISRLNPYMQENIRLRYLGDNDGTAYIAGLDAKLYGEFVEGIDSWISLSLLKGRQRLTGQSATPLPNAPSVNLSVFFQDYFPGFKPIRLSLRGVYSSGLPVAYPGQGFGGQSFTSSAYRRVDIGMTYRLTQRGDGRDQRWWRGNFVKYIDLGIDAFNLFDMLNTSSYYWITDAYGHSYAVPNYLTRRTWNAYLRIGL